ncbi:MAG: hypothetical protein MUF87_06975 [Anaerolineae bacterium]|jgi:hypothetical protein|nr:hypothetical protein [Anaerolineae bacterium]
MQSNRHLPDYLMQCLLFIKPRTTLEWQEAYQQSAERAFSFSLIFSGVRCILQYAVLPFILPLLGITTEATLPILLLINGLAITAIFFSLRRFWQIGYKYRWQYLIVAITALGLLVAFTLFDIQTMLAA